MASVSAAITPLDEEKSAVWSSGSSLPPTGANKVGRVAWLRWRAPSGGKRAFGCGAHVKRRDVTFTTAADERHSLSICPFPHLYLKPR